MSGLCQTRKEGASFLKKRSKKLLISFVPGVPNATGPD
jgi:hypothetical protein